MAVVRGRPALHVDAFSLGVAEGRVADVVSMLEQAAGSAVKIAARIAPLKCAVLVAFV